MVGWTLEGDLAGAILSLDEGLQQRVAKGAAWAGATVFYGEARTLAPVYTGPARQGIKPGQLQNAIYRAHSAALSVDGHYVYEISWSATKAPHGHLIENGHWRINRLVQGRTGRWYATTERLAQPVWVPPQPFITQAAGAAPRVVDAMQVRAGVIVQQLLADLAAGKKVSQEEGSDDGS